MLFWSAVICTRIANQGSVDLAGSPIESPAWFWRLTMSAWVDSPVSDVPEPANLHNNNYQARHMTRTRTKVNIRPRCAYEFAVIAPVAVSAPTNDKASWPLPAVMVAAGAPLVPGSDLESV